MIGNLDALCVVELREVWKWIFGLNYATNTAKMLDGHFTGRRRRKLVLRMKRCEMNYFDNGKFSANEVWFLGAIKTLSMRRFCGIMAAAVTNAY